MKLKWWLASNISHALYCCHPARRGSSRSAALGWRLGWRAAASGTPRQRGTTTGRRWAGRWGSPWCTRTSLPSPGWSPTAPSYEAQPHSSAWTWRSKALCMHPQRRRSNTAREVALWLTSETAAHIVAQSTRSNRRRWQHELENVGMDISRSTELHITCHVVKTWDVLYKQVANSYLMPYPVY